MNPQCPFCFGPAHKDACPPVEVDPELERLLAEEEKIERLTRHRDRELPQIRIV